MSLRFLVAALTAAGLLATPALAVTTPDAADQGWLRVAFDGPITEADRVGLLDAGVAVLQYVPDNAYLAYGAALSAADAATVAGVTGVRGLTVAEKTGSGLRNTAGSVTVQVVAAGTSTARTSALLGNLGALVDTSDLRGDGALTLLTATVDAARLPRLLADPAVAWVDRAPTAAALEDEGSSQVLAGNVASGTPAAGYPAFLAGLGIDGSGVVMSVVDDGIDANHPEFTGRVKRRFTYSALDMAVPSDGHGTHVAGIVGGRGATIGPAGPLRDSNGLAYGIGVAPAVTLVDQPALVVPIAGNSTTRPVAPFPPSDGFRGMVGEALSEKAIGWNASWTDGGGTGVGYTANGASLDALTRDGSATTAGEQPFTFVFSAGNSGSNANTITSPKEAKNIIVVASSRGHRAGDINAVSSFSSRGPARDGRIVPTVTAPGEVIMSARASTGVLCTAPASGNTSDSPPPDGAGLYTGCSGTSMASPHVAGAVALIHDWWRERHAGADSSPAMDKALLVNSTRDLGVADIPNRNEGWGRVDLGAMFDPSLGRVLSDQEVVLSDPGQEVTFRVQAADPSRPLRMTLAWTDAPGLPSPKDPALVNDLDLEVVAADSARYTGNGFNKGLSAAGRPADRLNNLEHVRFAAAGDGIYTVTVRAANLPGDGVPGTGDGTDQDYALVATNAVIVD